MSCWMTAAFVVTVAGCTTRSTWTPQEEVEPFAPRAPEGLESSTGDPHAPADQGAQGTPSASGGGGLISADAGSNLPVVCGGAQGDPANVKTLAWSISGKYEKYLLAPGQEINMPSGEPQHMSSTAPSTLGGAVVRDTGFSSLGSWGGGPFDTFGTFSTLAFASLMPKTDVGLHELGFTEAMESFFTVHTLEGPTKTRVAYLATRRDFPDWTYVGGKRPAYAPYKHFVSSITVAEGFGWLFTMKFDVECKAKAYDALVGDNALAFLTPRSSITRKTMSDFLIANGAAMALHVFQTGEADSRVKATLQQSTCSPADLAGCEKTIQSLEDAREAIQSTGVPTDADYPSIVAGTHPRWRIGRVKFGEVESLPSP